MLRIAGNVGIVRKNTGFIPAKYLTNQSVKGLPIPYRPSGMGGTIGFRK